MVEPVDSTIISLNNINTSNLNTNKIKNIDEYIEKGIETKINQLLETLPDDFNNPDKPIYNFTINELYKGTIQTIIDILNDILALIAEKDFITKQSYRERLFEIFLNKNRRIFIGIVFIFFSFILYFIDSASA